MSLHGKPMNLVKLSIYTFRLGVCFSQSILNLIQVTCLTDGTAKLSKYCTTWLGSVLEDFSILKRAAINKTRA
jgi:hypothetical protein